MCTNVRKVFTKMDLFRKVLTNGYIAIFPILVWNILLTAKLPLAYDPKSFDSSIPLTIIIGEHTFRSIIFTMPLFFKLKTIRPFLEQKGLIVFNFGVALYFSSWLILIYSPDSCWSHSLLGFASPAYTPIIWLVGLGLMVDSYYFKVEYSKWHFILPSIAFSIFHVSHTVYVYNRTY